MDILVVGGGVIGLSIALELLLAGHNVKVIVRDEKEGASWVAGGMLAPFSEGLKGDFLRFSVDSLKLWSEYLDILKDISKRNVFFSQGILRIALSEEEEKKLKEDVREYTQTYCQNVVSYEGSELLKEFPYITEDVRYGVIYGDEGNVDTEELMEALYRAVENLGGEIVREDVLRILREGDRVEKVYTFFDEFTADHYVFATGSWLKEHFGFPVYPVKGQILRVNAPIKDYVIYSSKAYIIPREKDLLIGATTEDAGFDHRKTLGGLSKLSGGAIEVIPSLSDAELLEVRVGFRPGTPDEMPVFYFGENFSVYGGHYRNGILLAPATAKVALRLIDNNEVSEFFKIFSPYRFKEEA
ncbi:glycine oxidase ThiO [Aquifex pyrophilus]